MDSSLILSLIGIVISLFTIATSSNQRNFKYKFSLFHYILVGVLLFLFIGALGIQGFYGIDETKKIDRYQYSVISFLLLIIISIYFAYLLFNQKINGKREFVYNLRKHYNANECAKIITDLDVYFADLMKSYLSEGPKQTEITAWDNISESEIKENIKYNRKNKYKIEFSKEFNNFLYDVFSDRRFVNEIATKNPFLGVRMIQSNLKSDLEGHFVELFLGELILNNNSILYTQIKNNQNLSYSSRYYLYPENYLLYALFDDIKSSNEKELDIYRPIGEGVIDYLRLQNRVEIDKENLFEEDYDEKSWKSPVFIGIKFFDIMIHEAIVNNVEWHMWLFYFANFTEYITENIKYVDDLNDREYENMYEYYLYLIFATYIRWIKFIGEEKVDYKIQLRKPDHEFENDNIVKSSIISLAQSMRIIAASSVRDMFKKYLFDMVINLYLNLKAHRKSFMNQYANVLISCIKNEIKGRTRLNQKMLDLMSSVLESYDLPKLMSIKDGRTFFQELKQEIASIKKN